MTINKKEMYACISEFTIATLGPKGTSSEFIAKDLAKTLGVKKENIILYSSYEEAFEMVKKKKNSLLLVANAYKNVNLFYMEDNISLIGSFVKETPLYGIASNNYKKNDFLSDKDIKIVSHHAPKSLIDTIINEYGLKIDIIDCLSTSEAAHLVNIGKYKYCLTNEEAQKKYNLNFIVPIKQITMLWSLFGESKLIATFDLLNKMNKFN